MDAAQLWRPIAEAPTDGTPVWAWLNETGILLMRWATPEECARAEGGRPDEYDGCWVEVADFDNDWSPSHWAPLEAIPLPPGASERMARALAKALEA
jgi:hypothetical protein